MDAEQVRKQPFIDCTRSSGYAYFRISKSMLQFGQEIGIDTDEVLLYTLLRDRAKLSYENKNYDEDGRIYVFCTRPNAAAYFGWSTRKVIGLFHSLVEHHLIDERPMFDGKGKQKATRIYLNTWSVPSLAFSQEKFDNLLFPSMTVDTLLTMDIGDYYVLPKTLIEDERYHGLSIRAMLLYMLLLDRISLSERYGRMDRNGLLWTTMDYDIISRELGCSQRSLSRATAELEEIALIERRAVSYAEKWRIYVRDFLPAAVVFEPEPTASDSPSVDNPSLDLQTNGAVLPFDAKSAPLCSQVCTPDMPDLHPISATFTPPVLPDLHPNKPSSKKPVYNYLSETTSIIVPLENCSNDELDLVMSVPQDKKIQMVKRLELQYQSMELTHYTDVVDICYTRLSESDAEQAVQILDFAIDVITDVLASPLPYQVLGRESIKTADIIMRLGELDEFITFLVIEKLLPRWDQIKEKAAYVRRIFYLASRQHRQEAFFLRKKIENEFLEGYDAAFSF